VKRQAPIIGLIDTLVIVGAVLTIAAVVLLFAQSYGRIRRSRTLTASIPKRIPSWIVSAVSNDVGQTEHGITRKTRLTVARLSFRAGYYGQNKPYGLLIHVLRLAVLKIIGSGLALANWRED
jgi:hypothetical protein